MVKQELASKKKPVRTHPLDRVPFEAFYHGSWHGVNVIHIKNGHISVQLNYQGSTIEDTISGDHLRLRSRKAGELDCSDFLKAGADVCVLSNHPIIEGSDDEQQKPIKMAVSWVDAKILSIKKDHQEGRCACLFNVVLNRNKIPYSFVNFTSNKVTTEVVTIEKIAILQKLHYEPHEEDGVHHWTASEDCATFKRSKLLTGTVLSEISWLIVYSVLKGMEFDMKLVQNRLVYHILNFFERTSRIADVLLNSDCDIISASPGEMIILYFQKSDETLKPKIETLFHVVVEQMTASDNAVQDHDQQSVNYESDLEVLYGYVNLRRSKRQKVLPERFTSYSDPNFNRDSSRKRASQSTAIVTSLFMDEEPCQTETPRITGREMNIDKFIEWLPAMQDSSSRAVVHEKTDSTSEALQVLDGNTEIVISEPPVPVEVHSLSDSESSDDSLSIEMEDTTDSFTSDSDTSDPNTSDPDTSGSDFSERRLWVGLKHEGQHEERKSKKVRSKQHKVHCHSSSSNQKKSSGRKKLLNTRDYKKLIKKLMEKQEPETGSRFQLDTEWTPYQPSEFLEEITDFKWSPDAEAEIEVDEHEDLWKQMEDALITLCLPEQKQNWEAEFSGGHNIASDKNAEQPCQHDYVLDDQIGITCRLCKFICTEIRHVTPQMFQSDGLFSSRETWRMEDLKWMGLYNLNSDQSVGNGNSSSNGYDSVWCPVYDLKSKLHNHQKRAFEFMWRNIAGSLNPSKMNHDSEDAGGCVISHTPGSGKTLSVISFLVSYLRLYPGSRPLVLAPKTAVYIWWKEFQKWGVSIPIHLIHPFESYKKEVWDPKYKHTSTVHNRPNVHMMHILDCLSKLKQWRETPSVLLMSYPAFFTFTFRESKLEYRKFMAEVLLNNPGLLILDEGHNPRSTISKLRKLLMRVNTQFRILLSGTLFQNNFEEYFNTLSLARPRFVDDVIRDLDPKMVNSLKKQRGRKINRKERLARKLFVEEIGQRIESTTEDDRMEGFNLLNKTTHKFIDSHDGDESHGLPGLQIYTIILASTDVQKEVLTELQSHITQKRCPLDLELLITVASIHPWLVKTVASVDVYLVQSFLDKIEADKHNYGSGSKVKFVVDLVRKSSMQGERVLVFCHNIPPINYFVQLFYDKFGWTRGNEVQVLQGDQELFERARIMEKFNADSNNQCKILLASTLACAEGISLTAASRVVLLDSEWNHAKTKQAIARAFRPGQTRKVFVYRLLALDTWEEDKYNSNEWKAWLSKMIFLGKYIKFTDSKKVEVAKEEDDLLKELVEEDEEEAGEKQKEPMIKMVLKQD